MAQLTVTVYGGAAGYEPPNEKDDTGRPQKGHLPEGEIGGNRILLEWSDIRWLLDFGTRFKATGRFYEEFLEPRGPTLGLRDYLRMGLLPPLEGLYRRDLADHDAGLWAPYREHPHYRRLDGVDGVLLSHGHIDHSGCLGFLRENVPVYTGLTTGGHRQDDPGPAADGARCRDLLCEPEAGERRRPAHRRAVAGGAHRADRAGADPPRAHAAAGLVRGERWPKKVIVARYGEAVPLG